MHIGYPMYQHLWEIHYHSDCAPQAISITWFRVNQNKVFRRDNPGVKVWGWFWHFAFQNTQVLHKDHWWNRGVKWQRWWGQLLRTAWDYHLGSGDAPWSSGSWNVVSLKGKWIDPRGRNASTPSMESLRLGVDAFKWRATFAKSFSKEDGW